MCFKISTAVAAPSLTSRISPSMPSPKSSYALPSDGPSSVVRKDHIESGFIKKLQGLKYEYRPDITARAALERNFRAKFEELNRVRLTDAEFADRFLQKCALAKTISHYRVLIVSEQKLMIMRPYQVYAVKQMVKCNEDDADNGNVWHTTGRGLSLANHAPCLVSFRRVAKN